MKPGSEWVKEEIALVMSSEECPTCHGQRLKPTSLAVTVGGLSISDYCEKSVVDALDFVDQLTLTEQQMRIGERILKEIKNRLGFLTLGGFGIPDALARAARRSPAAKRSASVWRRRSARA